MKIYEVELRGFDPKEDARDGATSQTILIETDETENNKIIKEAIQSGYSYVRWNPKLCEVLRCLGECEANGYFIDIQYKLKCKKCKRTFIRNTEDEVIAAWKKHVGLS